MAEEHPMRGGGKRPAWNRREARELEEEEQEGGPGENLKRGGRKRKAGGKAEGEWAPSRIDRKARGGKLTAAKRNALPESTFALPGRRYPINDPNHARNALARISQHGSPGEKAKVRAEVHRKYPAIGEK